MNLTRKRSMDDKPLTPANPTRRGFLRAAGGAGALGALAAIAAQDPPVVASAAPAGPPAPDAPSGYHETEHIRNYYRTARYW